MAALDYGVLSAVSPRQTNGNTAAVSPQPQTDTSSTQQSVAQAPPVQQFNLPPVEVPQTGGALSLADLPPAQGAVGSHPGRGGQSIQNIILHSSDGTESGDLNTLTQSHNAGAQFYVTRSGKIYPLVNLDDTAYHAGKVSDPSYSNEATIGIEQEHYDPGKEYPNGQDWPDEQVQSSARLVAALQDKYGLGNNNVLYHSQIAYPAGRKQDPYGYPRDKFDQFVIKARSGQQPQVAQAGPQQQMTIPPIVYPWQAMDPSSVTVGDVMQQQQQREIGNIAFVRPTTQPASNATTTIGTEFGEVDNPARGGYTEPGWNLGKWGDNLAGADTQGVALPQNVLAQYGDLADKNFASNFNSNYDVQVVNPQTGQSTTAPLKDIGPGAGTGAGLDMLMGTRSAVGLNENFKGPVQYAVVPKGQGAAAQQQQLASSAAGSITYPWQNMTAAVSSAQVNQAVQQALQRNALVSTQTGVPAGYNPPGTAQQIQQQQQNVGLVLSHTGDAQAKTNPANFGMRVATPDDVKAYNNYISNGGDPSAIDPYDKLAVVLAKNPQALLDPNNAQMLDEMVLKPQQAASQQKPLAEKVWDAISGGISGIGDAANSAAAYVRNEWKDTIPAVRALAEKATGQTPDPEALAGLTDIAATNAQGVGKAVSDTYHFLSQARLAAENLHVGIASMFTNDPQKLAQLHTQYVNNVQQLAADQQHVANIGTGLQAELANVYSQTGAFADVGQKLKTAQTDPQAVEGFSQIAQLIGPEALTAVAGMKAAGAFKPLLAEQALKTTTDLSEARAQKFMFDSTQTVPQDAAAEAGNPNYINARSTQANLAPDARAADAAFQQQSANLQQQVTSLNKVSGDPGTATAFANTVLNATGNAIGAAGDAVGKLNGLGDRWLNTLSGGNPVARGLIDKIGRGILFGIGSLGGHAWGGRLAEMAVDVLEDAPHIPEAASKLGDFFKTLGTEASYGETTVPYWTRVSQGTRLISPHMAAFMDSPAVQTISSAAKGLPAGMATGAFIGALGDPNDPLSGAISNAIPGGLYGMVGGGFGQWQRYNSPGEVYLKARGDWKRTVDTMPGQQQQQFLSLQPRDQLMLSTYLQQVPGLRVDFTHNPAGVQGQFDPHIHTFDSANKPTITVNLANPEGTVRGIFAHELMHATQSAGMTPDIYDALLGNVDREEPGQYTALDAKGNPMGVDPATSRYTTNQEFQNFKNDYVSSLARSGEPTAHLSDLDIARELFAEHGVDHLLSPQGAVDATSAFRPGWINQNMLKNAYAKLGFAFDRQGNMVQGTHLFDNVRPNDAVDKLTQKYFQARFRDRTIDNEELPTRAFTREDLRSTNAANTFLDTAPEILRNPDGSVMRDSRGVPLMRTPAQVRQYNAKLANDMLDRINALPDDRKNEIGLKTLPNGNTFVRYLPQELRDALAKTNEYNPHQIKGLNALSEMLADNTRMGTIFRMFYHKALSEGKRYGSFSGTEKFAVPYGFEVAKNDNVLLRSVDFDQLNQNYLNNATRAPFRQLWNNPSEFTQDWNTYFQNHSRGEPGAANGIGEQKRDAINALLRLDTSVNRDANPLLEARGGRGFASTRPIIKSYRIDRASQVTPLEKTSPFTTEQQYHQLNRNFRPRRAR